MRHFSFQDLKIFECEFNAFHHKIVTQLLRDDDTFYVKFKNSDFCVKFYSSFPGYRLVHIPCNLISGAEILNDLFPAKILASKVLNNDRVFGIWLRNRVHEFAIIFELLGSLSNLFVINEDGKIIYKGRRIKEQRSLRPGVIYSLPEKKQIKVPPRREEVLDITEINSGFVCKVGDELILEAKQPPTGADCIEYFPYSYALENYFNKIYGREEKRDFSASQLEAIISYLEENFELDDTIEEDFILIGEARFPVKKGARVSKIIGELRARVVSLTKSKGKSKSDELKGIMEFRSPTGKRVLVGRSAQANHRITFNLAKRDDLIFHVSGYKGAHVLLVSDGSPVSDGDIRFCAGLAIKFSNAGSGKYEVMYSPAKYVFRTKKMPLGFILFRKHKTVVVEK